MFQFVDSLILHPTVVRLGHELADAVFTVETTNRQTWKGSISALVLQSICFIFIILENTFKNVANGSFGLVILPFILIRLCFCVCDNSLFLFFFFNLHVLNYWSTVRCCQVFLSIIFYLYKIQIEILKAAIQLVCFAIFAGFTAILKSQIDYFMDLIEFLFKPFESILELLHVVTIDIFILKIIFCFSITMIEGLEFNYSFQRLSLF